MRTALLLLLSACAGCPKQPVATEPVEALMPPEAPTDWRIDGQTVTREAWQALYAQLQIEPDPFQHASIENEDGSWGGEEASYGAVHQGDQSRWEVVEVDFVGMEGEESRQRELNKR